MNLPTCPCGSAATHKIEIPIRTLRGIAFRTERYCAGHADRVAWGLLADGAGAVVVRPL